MAKFENIFGNFVMIGLMILALFSLIFVVQNNNEAPQPLSDDALFNNTFASLNDTIGSLEQTSDSKYTLFSEERPPPGVFSIVLFTIINVGKTFGNIIFVLFTIIIKIPLIILGIDPSIVSMLIAFLTISVIIALWVVYKFGG